MYIKRNRTETGTVTAGFQIHYTAMHPVLTVHQKWLPKSARLLPTWHKYHSPHAKLAFFEQILTSRPQIFKVSKCHFTAPPPKCKVGIFGQLLISQLKIFKVPLYPSPHPQMQSWHFWTDLGTPDSKYSLPTSVNRAENKAFEFVTFPSSRLLTTYLLYNINIG